MQVQFNYMSLMLRSLMDLKSRENFHQSFVKCWKNYNAFNADSKTRLLKRKVEIGKLIEKAQIRFGVSDISEDVYNATINKLREQEAENNTCLMMPPRTYRTSRNSSVK